MGAVPNPNYNPILAPYDLTQGGTLYAWKGRTDVKQLALYGEDQITAGNWMFNHGNSRRLYNGLTIQRQAEPRAGVSYNVKKTGTVLRVSYARTQETPFNENLVLSSRAAPTRCCTASLRRFRTEAVRPRLSRRSTRGSATSFMQGLDRPLGGTSC